MVATNLREQSSLIARLLHFVDCFMCVGYMAALVKWYNVPWNFYYTRLLIITFILSFISFQSVQLYRSWRGGQFYLEFFAILKGWVMVIGMLLFYFFIFKISHAYSRVVFMIWSCSTPFLIFLVHVFARSMLRSARRRGKNLRRAVVVGAGELGVRLVKEIEAMPWAGIEVLGFFDDARKDADVKESVNIPVIGTVDEVQSYLDHNDIDYVYIALPMKAEKKIFRILKECRSLGAKIFLIPDLYLYGLHNAELQSLGDLLILNFNPHTEWKRVFDIVFSIGILLITFPVFIVVALLIKLSDGGPVFYAHERITMSGRKFKCLKFRTMRVNADKELQKILDENESLREEWNKTFKLNKDPRITRIGKILRKTSLDEFPQFLNVLMGDMSVVGARPIVGCELDNYYKESAGRYCSMKPGITGPWQVGKRSDVDNYDERVKMDDWYILNYSLLTDMKIIGKTVVTMLKHNGK